MPYRLETGDRVDHLVNATIHLIDTEGIQSFTIRRLAAVARLSTSAITSHLENKWRMTDLFTKRIAQRLQWAIEDEAWERGVLAFAPDDEALPLVRAWLAMCALARSDDGLSEGVAYLQQDFLGLVRRAGRLGADDEEAGEIVLDALYALVVGVWTARCARSDPMSWERAIAVIESVCTALGVTVREAS